MSTFVISRTVTHDDWDTLNSRAEAFIARHRLDRHEIESYGLRTLAENLAFTLDCQEATGDPRLARLWRQVVARVAGDPRATGIAYGQFGHSAR